MISEVLLNPLRRDLYLGNKLGTVVFPNLVADVIDTRYDRYRLHIPDTFPPSNRIGEYFDVAHWIK